MSADDAFQIIQTIREEVEQAADVMLSAAERGLQDVRAAEEGDPAALERLGRAFCAILEACAFQDLTGQRLSKLSDAITSRSLHVPAADPLLNGPALPGEGLEQAAIDALLQQAAG